MTKSKERASHFLDCSIKPGLDDEKIFKLLNAMKASDNETVKDLSYELQVKLLLKNLSGKHLIAYECIIVSVHLRIYIIHNDM